MKKKILLVEDEPYIRDLYRMILESAGLDVYLAIDGEEGLKFAQNQPDLILLDIMLPKMNGIILLKKLKEIENTKNIPVVLLTNLGQESIIKSAFELGASGYLLKARLEPNEVTKEINPFLEDPKFKMNPNTIVFD